MISGSSYLGMVLILQDGRSIIYQVLEETAEVLIKNLRTEGFQDIDKRICTLKTNAEPSLTILANGDHHDSAFCAKLSSTKI